MFVTAVQVRAYELWATQLAQADIFSFRNFSQLLSS